MLRSIKYFFTILGVFCLTGFGHAQENAQQRKKNLATADDAFERLDYLRAFNLYNDVIKYDTANYQATYKAGVCLFNLSKTDTSCIHYFQKAKNKVPEAHLYLGKIYHLHGMSKKALEEFFYFRDFNSQEIISNAEVDQLIKTSENALKEEANRQTYIIRNVGSSINSSYSEYVPLVWNVNGSLVFTSRRTDSKGGMKDPYGRFYEDIYVSERTKNGWAAPHSLSDDINTNTHDACVAFSPSGNDLIIYRTDEKQTGGDLYLSHYDGTKWSVPEKMGPEINSEYLEASACFSADGNEIVFSSNRPGGLGGKDLYRVRKFMNGKYSLPFNLGPNVNTPYDEDAPFIDKNTNALYFSSKGHNTMGEYDIFKSEYDPETLKWKQAENLGLPINSTNDDIYFTMMDNSDAFFASRREGGFGDADIYEVNLNESSEQVVYCRLNIDNAVEKLDMKDIQLSIYNAETNKLEGIYRPNKNYMSMVLVVAKGVTHKIIVEGTGIEPIIKRMEFNENNKELTIDIHKKDKTN